MKLFKHKGRVTKREKEEVPSDVPSGIEFLDLCDYVNTLYDVLDESYQQYNEKDEDQFMDVAIDAMVAISKIERMKERVPA